MNIRPGRLKELRKRRNLSRDDLAAKAKISKRQIARLEKDTESPKRVREYTLMQLAEHLKVDQGVLTGELPMPKPEKTANEKDRVPITALMMSDTRLAYALIKRRYGINPTTIINMAPLFFVLLAEGSLAWRREKLDKFKEAAKQLRELQNGPDHYSFINAIYRAEEASYDEEESMRNLDLFGEKLSDDTFEFGYDPDESNPFADYLTNLALEIGDPDLVETIGHIQNAPMKGFPEYEVCNSELDKITNGSGAASLALRYGRVRLTDIPDELWAEDKSNDRARWIEGQAPDLKELFDSIDLEKLGLDAEEKNGNE